MQLRRTHKGSVSDSIVPRKATTVASSLSPQNGLRFLDAHGYPHSTSYKSADMEITIRSPSIRVPRARRLNQLCSPLPIFGDNDHVTGSVALNSQNVVSGRLTISIEGVFEYISPMSVTKAGPSQITPGRHRHVFYRDSAVISLDTASEPASRSGFRSALYTSMKAARSLERISPKETTRPKSRPRKQLSLTDAPRVFNFDFALPHSDLVSEELPPTFSASNIVSAGVRGRVYAENADVRYCVEALWEALDGTGACAKLEALVLFQPDTDFQSLDGLAFEPDFWSETVLSKVDNFPVECAITLPNPAAFPRSSSIPYFVVFTTKPRSRLLSAKVMANATIAMSLVRQVAFDKPYRMPLPRIQTDLMRGRPSTSSNNSADPPLSSSTDTSYSSMSPQTPVDSAADAMPIPKNRARPRFLERMAKSAPPILSMFRLLVLDPETIYDPHAALWAPERPKPLPAIPSEALGLRDTQTPHPDVQDKHRISDMRTLHTDVSVGFPKRPKGPMPEGHSHPSLEVIRGLPDGLYKGYIPLQKGWFPSVRWKGLDIEYFLQVSVMFDGKEFKTRVPVKIY